MKKLVCLFAALFLLTVSVAWAESSGLAIPDKKTFKTKSCDAATLAKDIEAWFRDKGYETQSSGKSATWFKSGTWLVQARKTEGWRQLAGVSMAFNVTITRKPHEFSVQSGIGDWATTGVAAAQRLMVSPVRLATDGWSVKVVSDLWKFIESRVGADKGK
ncbi:MAG: hypothetical protein HY912_17485 [Desulfomonile tiedjei]|uniref:Uncharacterized protein n=1 Tax=Desulfomonile tiedjei TaxID=2358 RepID=A0A9D6V4A5_9BACT|nr:hypothetical protein [Desulfomonile tiedjei]